MHLVSDSLTLSMILIMMDLLIVVKNIVISEFALAKIDDTIECINKPVIITFEGPTTLLNILY